MTKKIELISDWCPDAKKGLIPVKGGSVFYRIYGENKPGIPIIFIHGGPGHNATTFFRTTDLSVERPVVYYNQLGSEGSKISEEYQTAEKARELFTVERFSDELETLIDYFGFDEFVLVGHSWGSMLAVEFAGTKKPQGLRGLILAGPFLNVDLWLLDAKRLFRSLPDGEKMLKTVLACESTGEFTDEYHKVNIIYSNNFFNRIEGESALSPAEPERTIIPDFNIYNYMWGPTEFSCTGLLQGHDSTGLLKDIDIPILYVSGEYDSGSAAAAAYYNALTSKGKVVVVEGTGHETPRENPEAFNQAVTAFMQELEL